MDIPELQLLRLLASRLEHLSVDSHWARRASGVRGNIIKVLDEFDAGKDIQTDRIDMLVDVAFDLLKRAARDIPDIEAFLQQFNQGGGLR